ncbi:MAG: 50S ribosomal protein L4 [Nitrospirae bacterium]|nr:50S ribosomal protein L4 [Nitrospirota bacterium]
MLEVPVVDINNNKVGTVGLDEKIFGRTVNVPLLHEAVVMQLNNMRQGTHCTKTKGLVSGGGKKPYKQKGTGNARAGSSRSPVWVGGGTIFGPLPRDYSFRIPKKKSRSALYSALSSKLQDKTLFVIDSFDVETGKTRDVVAILKNLNIKGSVLIVCDYANSMAYRAVRNLPDTVIMDTRQVNVYDVIRYESLIISKADIAKLTEELA